MKLDKAMMTLSLVLFSGSIAVGQINLIPNPSFETPGTWGSADYWGDGATGGRSNAFARTGSWSMQVSDMATGDYRFPHATYELLDTSLGSQEVQVSAWAYSPSSSGLQGSDLGILKCEFFDDSGGLQHSSELSILSAAGPHDAWVFGSFGVTAPPDTASLVVSVMMGSDGNGAGEVYFDDVALYVPEPATFALLAIGGLALIRRRK